MGNSRPKIIEALKYAIQMELDGKIFYNTCASQAGNRIGRELFIWLAGQEDLHRIKFQEIFDSLTAKKGWPRLDVKPARIQNLNTLFGDALKETASTVKAEKGEIDSISHAIELEIKSRDYYKLQASQSQSEEDKTFFNLIASEEQGHYLSLIDYKEYISDPTGWFTRTEHHSLDGA